MADKAKTDRKSGASPSAARPQLVAWWPPGGLHAATRTEPCAGFGAGGDKKSVRGDRGGKAEEGRGNTRAHREMGILASEMCILSALELQAQLIVQAQLSLQA